MPPLTFEDFEVGERYEIGTETVSKSNIISFAEQYDPQPFHVDELKAAESHFGGLIASGWHTTAIMTGMCVQNLFTDVAAAGGIGVDELRWPAPVRPGDTLTGVVDVVETRPSTTRSDRGYVNFKMRLSNSRDETVLSLINRQIILCDSEAE